MGKDLPLAHGNSGLSLEESARPLSGSIASGYAATGSVSSTERLSLVVPPGENLDGKIGDPPSLLPPGHPHSRGQFSYPLQKLLAEGYDESIDGDAIDLDPAIAGEDHQIDIDAMASQLRVHQLEYENHPASRNLGLQSPEFHQEHDGRISIEV